MNNVKLYPMTHLSTNSLQTLVQHQNVLKLLLQKQGNQIHAYLSLDETEEVIKNLEAANIRVKEPADCSFPKEYLIFRKEERILAEESLNAKHVGGRQRKMYFSPMEKPFTLDWTIRAMKEGQCIYLELKPIGRVNPAPFMHPAMQERLREELSYRFTITTSSLEIAEAMIKDLSQANGIFQVKEKGAEPTRFNTMLTSNEVAFFMTALNELLSKTYTANIESLMEAGSSQRFSPDIHLGYHHGVPCGLQFYHFLRNVSVVGHVGSGKSQLMAAMIKQLREKDIPCLMIAPVKHDFSELFPDAELYRAGDPAHPLRFNLIDMGRQNSGAKLSAAAISNMVSLGGIDSVLPILLETSLGGLLAEGRTPTLPILATAVKAELDISTYKDETKETLTQAVLNRLRSLYDTEEFNCQISNLEFDRMIEPGNLTIVEFQEMEAGYRKAFATLLLESLRRFYLSLPNIGRKRPRLVVFIDELHELLEPKGAVDAFRTVLNNSLNTAGGQAVGFVFADQRLDLIDELAKDGASSHIIMRGRGDDQCKELLCLHEEDLKLLQQMPKFAPGELLLHVSGEDTLALSPLPLRTEACEPKVKQSIPYRPYTSCRCAECKPAIHEIAKCACQSNIAGRSYQGALKEAKAIYMKAKQNYDQEVESCKGNAAASAQIRKPISLKNTLMAVLNGTCWQTASNRAKEEGLITNKEAMLALQHCTHQELLRQLLFK